MAILDVVKNEGERGLTAWKYPRGELANGSQLLVREGEEAMLCTCDGAADRFTAGRHTLQTPNLPFLSRLLSLPFGGKSLFEAELWFVRVSEVLDIKWGTDAPIQPANGGDNLPLRGYGSLGVRIVDPAVFLSALWGRVDSFEQRTLAAYFHGQLSHSILETVAACYSQTGAEFFENAGVSALLAKELAGRVTPILVGYGMEPTSFIVSDLSTAGRGDGERQMTLSVRSIVIPPSRPSAQTALPRDARLKPRSKPVTAASLTLLILVLLIFCFLLPPRQTADFVGIAAVTTAHCLVTALVLWVTGERRGLQVTVGFTVTAALYWLGGVGVALAFRLLSIADTRLLMVLELGMVCVATLALMGFWHGREYDPTERKRGEAGDDADKNITGDE